MPVPRFSVRMRKRLQARRVLFSTEHVRRRLRPGDGASTPLEKEREMAKSDTVIVTVVGKNRPGVLAEVTGTIAALNGNIQDISQKMLEDYFNLVMIVDISNAKASFDQFQKQLESLGIDKGYRLHVQHEKVFTYMHRV